MLAHFTAYFSSLQQEPQGRIQDFVRGGAKPSDLRNIVVISAKMTLCFNSYAFVYSSSQLHTLKQAKNQSGAAKNSQESCTL